MTGDNVDGTTNIISMMGNELLHKGYKTVVNSLYTPKNYYARIRTFLREYKLPGVRAPFNIKYVMAFLRSVLHLGILGKERFHYWGLIIWTLFTRPKKVPLALTFAIYGYHFRRVVEQHIS